MGYGAGAQQQTRVVSPVEDAVEAAESATNAAVASTGVQTPENKTSETRVLPFRDGVWEESAALDSSAQVTNAEPQDEVEAEDSPRGAAGAAAGLGYGGLSSIEDESLVDGLSQRQSFGAGVRGSTRQGPHVGASFGEGAVRSFRVMPRTFSAQYGGAAGAVIAVVTEAGGEKLHGSLFVLGRESAWAAANPFSVVTHYSAGGVSADHVKPENLLLQFGGKVGGLLPGNILRGRVKAFGSLEAQVRTNPAESSPGFADFYRLTSTQTALLKTRGLNDSAIDSALRYLDSLTGTVTRSSTRTLGLLRADVEATKRDKVTMAWIRNRFSAAAGAGSGGNSDAVVAVGCASVGDSEVLIDAVTGRWLHQFSPRLQHELRAQVARDLEFETPRSPLPQEPAVSVGGFAPQVSIANVGASAAEGFTFGTPAGLGRSAYPDEKRVQLADSFAWLVGRHLLGLGVDWSRINDRVASVRNAEGTFAYDSGATNGRAGGLVDWITDYTFNVHAYPNGACPSITATVHDFCFRTYTQSFGAQQTEFVTHELAGYVEDAWRAREGLLVTGGVRYEYTLLPQPQAPNAVLDAGLRSVGARGVTSIFPEDRNNFGPRVGAVWTNRLVTVRAGYGVFFGKLPGATVRAALANTALPSSVTQVRFTPTTEGNCPQVAGPGSAAQGFGYACSFLTEPAGAVAATTQATVFAKNFRSPAVQRGTFSVERALSKRVTISVGYEGAVATQLPGSVDINVAPATTRAAFSLVGGAGWRGLQPGAVFVVPVYTQRLLPNYGPVSAITSGANATYHAGRVDVRARWREWDVRGSYTFSRSIDYGPQQNATPVISTQFDPVANGYDKGRSSLDVTHRFAGDLVWRSSAKSVWLRDWRVSAIGTAASGAPFSYGVFGGTRLNGGHETLNGSGGATYLPTVGRNTLRLPVRGSVDVRAGRSLDVNRFAPYRFRVEAYGEAFNVLNTRNLSRVETRAFVVGDAVAGVTPLVFQDAAAIASEGVVTPAFGAPTSSTSGLSRERQLELGVRVSF